MSTDFYIVCDNCKQKSENAMTHNMSGGYVLKDVLYAFISKHFLDICPVDGIRIVSEQSLEDETYICLEE